MNASYFEEASSALKQKDMQKAIELFKKSALKGNINSYFELGKIYYVKHDRLNALKYFKLASDYGNQKAKYNMAVLYAQKDFQKHNYQKSYKLFLELAKEGDAKAQNKIGLFLLYGWGVDKDYKQSVEWFENAYFKHQYKPAVCNLAVMFANGYGVFPNFGRASVLAQIGIKENLPRCKNIYKEFNLHKYPKDKSFKFGYYKNL